MKIRFLNYFKKNKLKPGTIFKARTGSLYMIVQTNNAIFTKDTFYISLQMPFQEEELNSKDIKAWYEEVKSSQEKPTFYKVTVNAINSYATYSLDFWRLGNLKWTFK